MWRIVPQKRLVDTKLALNMMSTIIPMGCFFPFFPPDAIFWARAGQGLTGSNHVLPKLRNHSQLLIAAEWERRLRNQYATSR